MRYCRSLSIRKNNGVDIVLLNGVVGDELEFVLCGQAGGVGWMVGGVGGTVRDQFEKVLLFVILIVCDHGGDRGDLALKAGAL